MKTRIRRPDRVLSDELLAQTRATQDDARIDEWQAPRPEGWTLAEMKRAANIGSSRIRFGASRLLGDATGIAWEGVALAVTLDPQASWRTACIAAAEAVSREASAIQHVHGLPQSDAHSGARVRTYWLDWLGAQQQSPDGCLERMALTQVLDGLDEPAREMLMLSAIMPSAEIAELLDLSPARVSQLLTAARRQAIALWHDWENPPRKLPRARVPVEQHDACPRGHAVAIRRLRGGWTRRYCATCARPIEGEDR